MKRVEDNSEEGTARKEATKGASGARDVNGERGEKSKEKERASAREDKGLSKGEGRCREKRPEEGRKRETTSFLPRLEELSLDPSFARPWRPRRRRPREESCFADGDVRRA